MPRLTLACLAAAAALLAPAAAAGAAADTSGLQLPQSAGAGKGAKIAGGYFPAADAWPWVTAMIDVTRTATNGDFGRGACTAVLIAPQRVLTAAHCVVGDDSQTPEPASKYQVLVGRRDLTNTTQGERRNVTGIAVHPKAYLPGSGTHRNHAFYDIAVLFLDAPVTATPATIGAPTDWNSWGTVMGWGHYNYDHNSPKYDPYLRAADLALLTDAQCGAIFNDAQTQHFYPAIHACADDSPNTPTIDCITHGDSGGPLMVRMTTGWRLIGITSFYPGRPGVCSGGAAGFAWVAGPEMRDWPLTVAHPPVVPVTTDTTDTTGQQQQQEQGQQQQQQGQQQQQVQTPPPLDLRMTRSDALGYVRSMIRAHSSSSIKRLKRTCSARNDHSFRCRVSWRAGRSTYTGIATFQHVARNGEVFWTHSFSGKRKQPGRKTRRVRW